MPINNNETAGPPSEQALPTVEKIPAPTMAAKPNAAKSRTPKSLFKDSE